MGAKTSGAVGAAALLSLAGCVTWTGPAPGLAWQADPAYSARPAHQAHSPPAPAASGHFDFSWELSGDRQAAPLQVFDDGQRMWMQFSPQQGNPGLWRPAPEGDMRAVDYTRQGPYVVLEGVWPALVVQARGKQASVRRQAAQAVAPQAAPVPAVSAAASLGAAPVSQAPASGPAETAAAQASALAASLGVPGDAAPAATFSVERADGHMRRTLGRWAGQAGWVFQPEHWSVDVDIPIAGDAVFELPFEQAVQALLAATELSDRPLQPCFYTNKVVRVVAFAQACDRTARPGEQA